MLETGQKAPLFTLKNQDGHDVKLKDCLASGAAVVYFYPRAMTPGCTVQAEGIRDIQKNLARAGVEVLAISPDAPEKLKKFEEKYDLNFQLLSDPEHKVADKYGVWGLKKFMGKESMGVIRSTFLVGQNGKVLHAMPKVKTKTHADDLLAAISDSMD